MYSQQELDEAVMKERERCIEKCKMVIEYYDKKYSNDNGFFEGKSCGAEDCIEAINGAWDNRE
jgi:hypothetical protein